MDLVYLATLALLVFGFGFVIFWHELGHFLAAKWAGVKVEQFAVGFGQALIAWRKGVGFTRGTSAKLVERRVAEERARIEAERKANTGELEPSRLTDEQVQERLGLGETEYRLNWIPLGGYVKMLGQDDMDAAARSDNPRSYTQKPIGKRMVIVSAGVIMNIILAVIGFTVLFAFIGFNSPPPVVGMVLAGSPAQQAGIQVGDRIREIDGRFQHDFTKIGPNVALSEDGRALPVVIEGRPEAVMVTPRKSDIDPYGFLQIGVAPMPQLTGVDPRKLTAEQRKLLADEPVRPGDTIVEVNGEPVSFDEKHNDYPKLDRAVQSGRPVPITVRTAAGTTEQRTVIPTFAPPFTRTPLNFAGMLPRTLVQGIEPWSSANGKLQKGDVIVEVTVQKTNDSKRHPTVTELQKLLDEAGKQDLAVRFTVLRKDPAGGEFNEHQFADLLPNKSGSDGRKILGIALDLDVDHAVVAGTLPEAAAAAAGIAAGSQIKSVNGQPIENWRDVQAALAAVTTPDQPVKLTLGTGDARPKQVEMKLTAAQLEGVRQNRYIPGLVLGEWRSPRQTNSPLTAAQWGVGETRDLSVQFYLTLRRMVQGSVSPKNAMGPIGIFHHGSVIAYRGLDWVVWFLAMISANLAVVNFLPIPIVDGGLFLFLILEKVMGRPLSPKAQGIAQLVGLALIAGVFLFVTYNDISRLVF